MLGLPAEIWFEIFLYYSPEDKTTLAKLCLVSKSFYSNAVRRLYFQLNIDESSVVIRQTRTIIQNTDAARSVRRIVLRPNRIYHSNVGRTLLHAYFRHIVNVFRSTSNVETLDVHTNTPDYSPVIDSVTFPRLRALSGYRTDLTPSRSAFIHRHRTLKEISVTQPLLQETISERYDLPHLEFFTGPASLVASFVPGAPVHVVHMSWDKHDYTTELGSVMEALTKSTASLVEFTVRQMSSWSFDVLDALATYIPDLCSITLSNPFGGSSGYSDASIITSLSRMKRLRSFSMSSFNFMMNPDSDLNEHFITAISWGTACPSLEFCELPGSVEWRRRGSRIWLPNPKNRSSAAWVKGMLQGESPETVENFLQAFTALFSCNALSPQDQHLLDTVSHRF